MKRRVFSRVVCLAAVLMLVGSFAYAQAEPTALKIKLKKWNAPGAGEFRGLLGWTSVVLPADGESQIALLFYKAVEEASAPGVDEKKMFEAGFTAVVNKETGKVEKWIKMPTYNDMIFGGDISAVDYMPGTVGFGMNYLAQDANQPMASAWTWNVPENELSQPYDMYYGTKLASDQYIHDGSLHGLANGMASAGVSNNVFENSDEYHGPLIPDLAMLEALYGEGDPCRYDSWDVSLPVKTNSYMARFGGPAVFEGISYYPIYGTLTERYEFEGTDGFSYEGSFVAGASGLRFIFSPPAKKVRARMIVSNDLSMSYSLRWPRFIPDTIDGKNVVLYYQSWEYGAANALDGFKITHTLHSVSKKGKGVGNPVPVTAPDWKHRLKYDAGKYNSNYAQMTSNFVPLGNKRYLFLLGRTLVRRSFGSPSPPAVSPGAKPKDTEMEARIMVLNLDTKTAESMGTLKLKYKEGEVIDQVEVFHHADDLVFFASLRNTQDNSRQVFLGFSNKSNFE